MRHFGFDFELCTFLILQTKQFVRSDQFLATHIIASGRQTNLQWSNTTAHLALTNLHMLTNLYVFLATRQLYFSCIVEYYILIFWQNKVMMMMMHTISQYIIICTCWLQYPFNPFAYNLQVTYQMSISWLCSYSLNYTSTVYIISILCYFVAPLLLSLLLALFLLVKLILLFAGVWPHTAGKDLYIISTTSRVAWSCTILFCVMWMRL